MKNMTTILTQYVKSIHEVCYKSTVERTSVYWAKKHLDAHEQIDVQDILEREREDHRYNVMFLRQVVDAKQEELTKKHMD